MKKVLFLFLSAILLLSTFNASVPFCAVAGTATDATAKMAITPAIFLKIEILIVLFIIYFLYILIA